MTPTGKTIGAHALTSAVTLAIVLALFGGRLAAQRSAPIAQIPGAPRFPTPSQERAQAPRSPTHVPPVPPSVVAPTPSAPEPPAGGVAVPEEVVRAASADEQVNIRVYAAVNRSVVNITTEAQV